MIAQVLANKPVHFALLIKIDLEKKKKKILNSTDILGPLYSYLLSLSRNEFPGVFLAESRLLRSYDKI